MFGLKILQFNLNHSELGTDQLCHRLRVCDFNVALVQEPWINERQNKIQGIGSDLKVYRSDEEKPRTCIVTRQGINAWLMTQFTNRDTTTVMVREEGGRKLILTSAYIPHNDGDPANVPGECIERLADYCAKERVPLVIGSDANAQNVIWGSSKINPRGEKLQEFLEEKELITVNEGNAPTFIARGRREVLDVTIADWRTANRITDWRVLMGDDSSSDHKEIAFQIEANPREEKKEVMQTKKTNWMKFIEIVTRDLGEKPKLQNVTEVEEEATKVGQVLQKAIKVTTPRTTIASRKKHTYGWSKELSELKRKSRNLQNRAQRSDTNTDWDAYTQARNTYKKELRKVKKNAFKSFCEECDNIPAVARLNKIMTKTSISWNRMMRRPNGEHTCSPEESLGVMLDAYFPGSQTHEEGTEEGSGEEREVLADLVTGIKVREAIKSFEPYKAGGPDGIKPIHLQKTIKILTPRLTNLYKACLRFSYVPKDWRKARAVFIAKPGKAAYDNPKAFRPLCLTSFLLKTMERVIDWYIKESVITVRPLDTHQYAYQSERSTETAVHKIVQKAEEAMENGQYALLTLIDVEGAFNNAPMETMMNGMKKFPIDESVMKWIDKVLSSRIVQVDMEGGQVERDVKRGTPQGGVISPMIWNMTIDPLLKHIRKEHSSVHIQAFADDVALMVTGIDPDMMRLLMQAALTDTTIWCKDNGLGVNPSKTEAIMFTLKRNWKRTPLILEGVKIPLKENVKYLGITLDQKLNWTAHVEEKVKKMQRLLYQGKRIMGKSWGVTPAAAKWIYTAVVRPILAYGCVIWAPALDKKTVCDKLVKLQRIACLGITGAMRTTPTASLEAITGLPPLDIYLKGESVKGMMRLKTQKQWGKWKIPGRRLHKISHVKWAENEGKKVGGLEIPTDYMGPKFMFSKKYRVSIPSRSDWEPGGTEPKNASVVCYTDGSKIDDNTGSGIVITSNGEKTEKVIPLGRTVSVYQAELHAILVATQSLLEGKVTGKRIIMYSDSQAGLKAIQRYKICSQQERECMIALNELGRRNNVRVSWVPGHAGIEGNEEVDQIAKKAAKTKMIGPEPGLPVSNECLKSKVNQYVYKQHEKRWKSVQGLRQSKLAIKGPHRGGDLKKAMALNRKELRWLVGMKTGHCRLNRHLALLRVVNSARCPKCNAEEETPYHHGGVCPRYYTIRQLVFGRPALTEEEFYAEPMGKWIAYLRKTGRLEEELQTVAEE